MLAVLLIFYFIFFIIPLRQVHEIYVPLIVSVYTVYCWLVVSADLCVVVALAGRTLHLLALVSYKKHKASAGNFP